MLSEKIYTTLKNPVITEKAAIEKSTSNTYVFKVAKEATKIDIKNSIEEIFGVTVDSVRVLNTKFKNKRTRFGKYKTSTYKKAFLYVLVLYLPNLVLLFLNLVFKTRTESTVTPKISSIEFLMSIFVASFATLNT